MIQKLFDFLNESPVNFLAVDAVKRRLDNAGFRQFDPGTPMDCPKQGDKFYVTKNDSSIHAFHIGEQPLASAGFHILCAHADSPTFRIKPNPEIKSDGGLIKLNVEAYGGGILNTWCDRPLSLAGRVILKSSDIMRPESRLVHIRRPLMTIPNLAIHFNRQVNDGVKLSIQKDMQPIIGYAAETLENNAFLTRIISAELGVNPGDILDFDLYLYDTSAPCTFGAHDEFISAGRLDDLSMVHAGLEALLDAAIHTPQTTRILSIFDNEETGSHTKQGAASPFLANMIKRIVAAQGGNEDDFCRSLEHAFMISADNAHAYHPNYGEKYDPACHCLLGKGPAIKFNAAQKYASDAPSASIFASLCADVGVNCQRFVNHSDVAGGSTLGNILTSSLPVSGVDIGNPILAMHSVRETGAVADHEACIKVFTRFYR